MRMGEGATKTGRHLDRPAPQLRSDGRRLSVSSLSRSRCKRHGKAAEVLHLQLRAEYTARSLGVYNSSRPDMTLGVSLPTSLSGCGPVRRRVMEVYKGSPPAHVAAVDFWIGTCTYHVPIFVSLTCSCLLLSTPCTQAAASHE